MDKNTLIKLQKTILSMFSDLDKYLIKHEINYSLAFGTALGAVRHNGFIPWDDDFDICMSRENYNKFCAVWKQAPMNGYYFENYIDEYVSDICHGKIRKDGTVLLSEGDINYPGHHGIWIDIFPMDKITDKNSRQIKWIGKKIILLTRANVILHRDSLINKVIKRIVRIIPKKSRYKMLIKWTDWLNENDKRIQKDYRWVSLSTNDYLNEELPCGIFDSYVDIEFESKRFKITSDYQNYLKAIYGDFMKLPPLEERVCKHTPMKIVFGDQEQI